MTPTRWEGCYGDGWEKGDVVDEAFTHPAKFSKALIFRIIAHLMREKYLAKNSTVLDPFGGVALGALPCMTYGLHYSGVELEPRFVEIGQRNLQLWRQRFGLTTGQLLQGDSRQLGTVLAGQAQGMVTSPPFCETAPYQDKHFRLNDGRKALPQGQEGYGSATGQLGAMPAGALVTSPPFLDQGQGDSRPLGGITRQVWADGRQTDKHHLGNAYYGSTPGQLGAMPAGQAQGMVTSPPFTPRTPPANARPGEAILLKNMPVDGYGTTPGQLGAMPAGALVTSPPFQGCLAGRQGWDDLTHRPDGSPFGAGKALQNDYGHSPGQIGVETSDTFWAAATAILTACWPLLQPGAICAFVLKDYVRKGKRVPFCAQWRTCCEAVGYVFVEEIHAMLVEDHGTQTTIFGEDETVSTSRKSFFRRLAEKKGSPRIDYETVLLMRRP